MTGRPAKRAFTLVELLVVIGIIALLLGVLLPALNKAREAGKRVACASNMRQIGIAFENYMVDSRGVYPPLLYFDDWKSSSYSAAKTVGFDGLLRKYLGKPQSDPKQPDDLGIFKCPSDDLLRFGYYLSAGAITYQMPISWGPDNIYHGIRDKSPFNTGTITSGTTLNRGIGQYWDGPTATPMWVKKSMVKPPTKALVLVERSYAHGAQATTDGRGYGINRPGQQINFIDGAHGNPLLHARRGRETVAYFNYLFADNHVELLHPKETVRDQSTLLWQDGNYGTYWKGGDYMWTIRPDQYKN